MTRILMLAVATVVAASGCCGGLGLRRDRESSRLENLYDPAWPERYSHTARLTTLQPFQAQAANGEVMSSTVWNYHFEHGSDVLTGAGRQTLDHFVTRRPAPNNRVYLQTTRDIAYDVAAPEKYADSRRDLDERRAKAIHKYLAAQTAGRPTNFEVQVIDPSDPAISARYGTAAIRALEGQYGATIGGMGIGGGMGGVGGGLGAGGGGGGFGGGANR